MDDKNLLDVHEEIKKYIALYPTPSPIDCEKFTKYNDYAFDIDTIVTFMEYPVTIDRAINNTKHTTTFMLHVCIMSETGDDTLMVFPPLIKKYLEVYKNEFINSIFIYRTTKIWFDKEKSVWDCILVGDIVWDDKI